MFKNIARAWNARTPDYLHPNTKENLIWQLKLTGVLLVFIVGKGLYEDHQMRKKYSTDNA